MCVAHARRGHCAGGSGRCFVPGGNACVRVCDDEGGDVSSNGARHFAATPLSMAIYCRDKNQVTIAYKRVPNVAFSPHTVPGSIRWFMAIVIIINTGIP